MICIETQYFNLNKSLLLAIGLWPYQQTKLIRLQFIFFLGILITAILFQFTTLLTSKCTLDLVVKVLSTTLFFTLFVIKYISFSLNIEVVKDLLMQLQHIYNQLKDKNENNIIKKYGYNAKRYTAVLTVLGICCVSALIVVQVWSSFLDVVVPINVSRSHRMHFVTEYFIDQERYFFLILLHMNAAFCIGAAAMLATGTMLIVYLQHICGIFKISSYRFECTMDIDILQNMCLKKENLILEGIISAVNIHRQAMRLSQLLVSRFETMLFCLIMVGVISLSTNLFRIFQIASSEDGAAEYSLPVAFAVTSILYMFLANNVGQSVIDHNNHVLTTVYNVQWYSAPLHIQKMILFLLQRGAKDFVLNVGGLFVGSLECFASLVKASVSYFTVIYSTR